MVSEEFFSLGLNSSYSRNLKGENRGGLIGPPVPRETSPHWDPKAQAPSIGATGTPSSLKAAWISLDNRRRRLDKRPLCLPGVGLRGLQRRLSCTGRCVHSTPALGTASASTLPGRLLGPAARCPSADVEPSRTHGPGALSKLLGYRKDDCALVQTLTVQSLNGWTLVGRRVSVIASISQRSGP